MRILHGIAKPVIPQMGRLGRCWPSSQVGRLSDSVLEAGRVIRQMCSAEYGGSNGSSITKSRKEG